MKVINLLYSILLIFITFTFGIRPRQKAPEFKTLGVLRDKVQKYSLSDFLGKYLVLIFYPSDFTYVCPTELISFSENIKEFDQLQTQLLGISTDSHFSHSAWMKTSRKQGGIEFLNYPLIADFNKSMSKNYGFLVEDEEDSLQGHALRGLVIIDENGIIRHISVNDAPVGRSVSEVIRLIQGFKYTDSHGEVCPVNWKPGFKTIIPDQVEKLKFFEEEF